MKRLVCVALLGAAAFAATPAQAAPKYPVKPIVWTQSNRVGVGFTYDFGHGEEPGGGAWVNPQTGQVCVGFSYQIPLCTP